MKQKEQQPGVKSTAHIVFIKATETAERLWR